MSRTINLDGVKIKHFSMLFSVGPGACLLHLLLVYLTFALVGLCPYMSWATRLLPLLISAIYLGLTQFNILCNLSNGASEYAVITMIPLAAISFFGEIQVAVAMSHLEGGLDQQWQISLTPMWFLGVLMLPACIITVVVIVCVMYNNIETLPRGGELVAYAVFGVIATILVACTLMMACHNDNTWDAATQKGHYSWLSVMVPLMLLVGDYLLLMLVDIVGDCVVHVIRFYRRLENKARMYRNQAIERTNHLAGPSDSSRSVAFAVDNIFNEKEATPHSEFLVHLQSTRASLLENSFTNKSDSAYRSIASVETAKTHEMILIALSSLRNHLERHPKERTDTLKWELLEVCRRREEEGCWSKDNAVVLREILSLFTQLGAVLEQSHTSTIRIVEEPDKPQPPMAR